MPETFPEWSDTENRLVDRDYWSLVEVADMLHMSESTARRMMEAASWPHLQANRRAWFSARDIGAIVESMRQGDTPPERADAPALGWSVPPDPWDKGATGEDADQDPGGVR